MYTYCIIIQQFIIKNNDKTFIKNSNVSMKKLKINALRKNNNVTIKFFIDARISPKMF